MIDSNHPAFRILPVRLAILLAILVALLMIAVLVDRAATTIWRESLGSGTEQRLAK